MQAPPTSSLPEPATTVRRPAARAVELSIVVPAFDEAENVEPLYRALTEVLRGPGKTYEIVFVDDGSTDATYTQLVELARRDHAVKVIQLRRNFGQTAAMVAGFDHAGGKVVIPIDADLQNDPADIPLLLAKIDEGYDVVSGWRKDRKDGRLSRRVPSRIANWLIGVVTGVRLHDYGCTLKAYRAEILEHTRLYGEQHRFLPALAHQMGARITEVPVRHHPRRSGSSKYGLGRTLKVLLDLMTLKFLSDYGTKPIYVFGASGLLLCLGGILAGVYTLYHKYVNDIYVHRNPAILLAIFLFTLGILFILMGLLAELIIRTYHESQGRTTYWVRETHNLDEPALD